MLPNREVGLESACREERQRGSSSKRKQSVHARRPSTSARRSLCLWGSLVVFIVGLSQGGHLQLSVFLGQTAVCGSFFSRFGEQNNTLPSPTHLSLSSIPTPSALLCLIVHHLASHCRASLALFCSDDIRLLVCTIILHSRLHWSVD